jgi:hypothetical protein
MDDRRMNKEPLHRLSACQVSWRRTAPLLLTLAMYGSVATAAGTPHTGVATPQAHGNSQGVLKGVARGKTACVRPNSLRNHIYRRKNGALSRWLPADTVTHTLPRLSATAVRTAENDHVFAEGGELFVKMRTEAGTRIARVVHDDTGYRIKLEGGVDGPHVTRQRGNLWDLADNHDVKGSYIARAISEDITTDGQTLNHAAGVLERLGLSETRLAMPDAIDVANLAVGQAFIETLPGRLRDPAAIAWTPWEVRQIAPGMARQTERTLSFYREDGTFEYAVQPDGAAVAEASVPGSALQLKRIGERYVLRATGQPGTTRDYRTVFAAVEEATRPPEDLRVREPAAFEAELRTKLAESIEARSTFPEFERMQASLINAQGQNHSPGHESKLRDVSRLHHALFDKHHALTAADEGRLIGAVRTLLLNKQHPLDIEVRRHGTGELLALYGLPPNLPAAPPLPPIFPAAPPVIPFGQRIVIEAEVAADGRRIAYYRRDNHGDPIRSRPVDESFSPIIDVLLNAGNGELRIALSKGEWDWRLFANDVLARIVRDEDGLLSAYDEYLVVNDASVLAQARGHDRWVAGGRQFVTLTNLEGRTQVVETSLAPTSGTYYRVIRPGSAIAIGYAGSVVERDGRWYRF